MNAHAIIESLQLDLMVKGAVDVAAMRPLVDRLAEPLAGTDLAPLVDELVVILEYPRVAVSPCLYETLLERLETLRQASGGQAAALPLLAYDLDLGPRIMRTFLDEAMEHLTECERGLLALERQPDDRALVDELFRGFHSLKGETATIGLVALRRVAHACEETLARVRGGGAPLSGSETDHLLAAVDLLRVALQRLGEHVARPNDPLPVMPETWVGWQQGPLRNTPPPMPRITGEEAAAHATAAAAEAHEPGTETVRRDPTTTMRRRPTTKVYAPGAAAVGVPTTAVQLANGLRVAEVGSFPAVDPATAAWLLAQAELGEVLGSTDKRYPGLLEQQLAAGDDPAALQGVRVPVERIDAISGQVATGLMLAQQLALLARTGSDGGHIAAQRLDKHLDQLTGLLRQLQTTCLSLRLVNVGDTFARVRRTARDLSRQIGKKLEVHVAGTEVELDKTILDGLAAPLMHLVRNALDHGMETPEERLAAGKPERCRLALEARRKAGRVIIEIADDGRGLDLERIRRRALEIGLLQPQQRPSREELISLIFLPGFSTAKAVSELSGRGVGMDVVRQSVQSLGGSVTVRTDAGKFTSFLLDLPVSLALQETLLVRAGAHQYLVPQGTLAESVRLNGAKLGRVQRIGLLLDWRGTAVPLICLHDFAGGVREPDATMHALIVRQGNQCFALAVDEVLGMRQVLIRPLGEALSGLRGFVGGSLMEDGRVLLVLDPLDALRAILGRRGFTAAASPSPATSRTA